MNKVTATKQLFCHGLFQLFWEKGPGLKLNWEYAAFCDFFRSVDC